jgi:hypothetical protein
VRNPDLVEFAVGTTGAQIIGDLQHAIRAGLGRAGLMMFLKLDTE